MNRCPYCFKPLPSNGICDCHYEESPFFRNTEVLHPGSVVGACYQIGRVLGQGGFGITYQGYDLDLEKVIAIKEFYPKGLVIRAGAVTGTQNRHDASSSMVVGVSTDSNSVYEKSLNAFFKEAKALARMSDIPNVVQVHRIFRENGTAYIVMDFVEGKSLKQLMREKGPIPEKILLPMLDPVLESMG
ncbi:MAG: protein kinase, partial [Anaerolineaceae bacterium]|nr:protein kinase [Anaerolineaceae bacterium]